jgi:hypothetical protein
MTRTLKVSLAAFAAAVLVGATAPEAKAKGEAEATCHAKACDLETGPAICCLQQSGNLTCTPCGGVETVGGNAE